MRKEELIDRINSAEPYKQWKCKDHNTMGNTMPYSCCREELKKIEREEAHETLDNYCCTCEYDQAVFEDKLKQELEKLRLELNK